MQLSVSKEIGELLDSAAEVSRSRGKTYVGIEHLFEAAIRSEQCPRTGTLSPYETLLDKTAQVCTATGWKGVTPTIDSDVFYTPRCAHLVAEASRIANRLNHATTTTAHVLLVTFLDDASLPSRCMDSLEPMREKVVVALHEFVTEQSKRASESQPASAVQSPNAPIQALAPETETAPLTSTRTAQNSDESPVTPELTLADFTRDLTRMARAGTNFEAVGRKREVVQIAEICARQGKNSVILVGEAGTGKTRVVEDFALRVARGTFRESIPHTRVLELNVAALMSGTQYRGSFEDKIVALLDELKSRKDTILFIDEIHLIMGAGATDGDSMDLANLLKPALGRGEIQVIGATTLKEYRQFIAKDPALERRLQMVRIEQMTPRATMRVLLKLVPVLEKHHKVEIDKESLRAVVQLTQRYLPNRNFPDKAIDILDQACASFRINAVMQKRNSDDSNVNAISPHYIRKVISQVASVPVEEITREERKRLANLGVRLKRKIVGQDEAVNKVVAAVVKSRAGLADPHRPDAVLLFLGPTGVGKTQLCKELARYVYGPRDHLLTFDMSEYSEPHSISKLIGAPPGYVGSDQEGVLTGAVQDSPFSIILFDEIEKADSRIFDIFLPILDEGRIKDSNGTTVNFKNSIIIFTSNVGAEVLSRGGQQTDRDEVIQALEEHFRPEFINRIDEIVPFYPLLQEDVRTLLDSMLNEVRRRMRDRDIKMHVYQRAYEYLYQEGYSAEYGARELKRAVERLVVNPISQSIIDGTFSDGDYIEIKMEDEQLVFTKGSPPELRTPIPEELPL